MRANCLPASNGALPVGEVSVGGLSLLIRFLGESRAVKVQVLERLGLTTCGDGFSESEKGL